MAWPLGRLWNVRNEGVYQTGATRRMRAPDPPLYLRISPRFSNTQFYARGRVRKGEVKCGIPLGPPPRGAACLDLCRRCLTFSFPPVSLYKQIQIIPKHDNYQSSINMSIVHSSAPRIAYIFIVSYIIFYLHFGVKSHQRYGLTYYTVTSLLWGDELFGRFTHARNTVYIVCFRYLH